MNSLRRVLAIATVLVVSASMTAACTDADLDVSSGGGRSRSGDDLPDDLELIALDDIERYWDEEFPAVYGDDFEPVEGGFFPYGPDTDVPECGGVELAYRDVADNAFYCGPDDYIAWDDDGLLTDVAEDYGPLAAAVIMAHEYGHAIQNRAVDLDPGVVYELQADCFAGAWTAAADNDSGLFSDADGALDDAIAGFLELSDALGTNPNDPFSHGSGFDRISAFQTGYESGATRCAAFESEPPVIVQMPFGSASDFEQGGNLPTDQFLELYPTDLEAFWSALFDQLGQDWSPVSGLTLVDGAATSVDCGDERFDGAALERIAIYCAADNRIYIDSVTLLPELESIGDLAIGAELLRLYALVALERLGIDGGPETTALQADCLAGVNLAAQFNETIPGQRLVLSPGDLDEVLINYLSVRERDLDVEPGTRISSFRVGFTEGLDGCEL